MLKNNGRIEYFLDKYSTNTIRKEIIVYISRINSRFHPWAFSVLTSENMRLSA